MKSSNPTSIGSFLRFTATTLLAFTSGRSITTDQHSNESAIDVFQREIIPKIQDHPANHHSLFPSMVERAQKEGIYAEEVRRLGESWFARIYATTSNIAALLEEALLNNDFSTAETAMKNLEEEIGGHHPQLAVKAWNALANVFELPDFDMKASYENSPLPEAHSYNTLVKRLYHSPYPAAVSYAQERASGGNNTEANPGMMGDLYKFFLLFRDHMPTKTWNTEVMPYFAAHISIDRETYQQVYEGNAVEYQHGVRAEADAARQCVNSVRKCLLYMQMFQNSQKDFFDAITKHINENTAKTGKYILPPFKQEGAIETSHILPFTQVCKASSQAPQPHTTRGAAR